MSFNTTELADRLIGTCNNTDKDVEEISDGEFDDLMDLPYETLLELDEIVLLCTFCGWWCASDEVNTDDGDAVCSDCKDEY